jgi:uncharacterized protein (TIGR02265 family)
VAGSSELPSQWEDPPWSAPLDADAAIAAIPAGASMSGMFLAGVVELAKSKHATLPSARPSYVPFRPYPLREHCVLLVEAARAIYPTESLRQGLRRIGRGAPGTLVSSMLGKVVLGSVEGPSAIFAAMATSYAHHMRPASLEVVELAPGDVVVRLREVWHFLDSHHVGVFEGVLRYAGVEGTVKVHVRSASAADFRCTFRPK